MYKGCPEFLFNIRLTPVHCSLRLTRVSMLSDDLECVQKSAIKIKMGSSFKSYMKSLEILDLATLSERRRHLCLKFAKSCVKNPKSNDMFPRNVKQHAMETRKQEVYQVEHANTERYKNSAIIYMQNLLNEHEANI